VVEVIAREDHQGPFGAEASGEERRSDAPGRRQGPRIGDLAPFSVFTGRQPDTIWRHFRPVLQPLREFFGIGVERAGVADHQGAVGPTLHRRMAIAQLWIAKRRVQHQRILSHPCSP
jgi:hypothetical protein